MSYATVKQHPSEVGMARGPSRPYPPIVLKEVAKLAQAIRDSNAGRPMNRILLAHAMGRSPSSTQFRDLITSSGKYGFTNGNYGSESIELTELGQQLTTPRSQEEHLDALRQGMRNIPLFDQVLTHFNNNKLPPPEFLRNTLERDTFKVQPEWAQEAAELFTENGREVGFVRQVAGSPYVILESGPPVEDTQSDIRETLVAPNETRADGKPLTADALGADQLAIDVPRPVAPNSASSPPSPAPPEGLTRPESRQFLIAHGWDKEALQQVQNILNRFHIPYVVAQEEPSAGRPISQKVHDLIKSCSAGIFIFSADQEFRNKDGETIWRPRENVIYELGAASLEYGQRIVVFKERGVYFPSDFSDLGHIEYEKGKLEAKAMDLIMELIALGAVKITAGS